jgi:hypothetical protein
VRLRPPAPFVPFSTVAAILVQSIPARRAPGSGFFVAWRLGNSERYVCNLSAAEWGTAKKRSSASFTHLTTAKLNARRVGGETLNKIARLHDIVKAFARIRCACGSLA